RVILLLFLLLLFVASGAPFAQVRRAVYYEILSTSIDFRPPPLIYRMLTPFYFAIFLLRRRFLDVYSKLHEGRIGFIWRVALGRQQLVQITKLISMQHDLRVGRQISSVGEHEL